MPEYGELLSNREKEILRLAATGVTNREIAYRLSISVNTVKVHLRNVFIKLGAESRTEATMIAMREGWVAIESAAAVLEGGETAPAEALPTPVPPSPPLPWPRRAALVVALLLVVTGIIMTWPRSQPQANGGPDRPFDQTGGQASENPPPATGSPWHEQAQMPTRRAYLALGVARSRIVAIGGQTSDGVTAAVEVYNPQNDTWNSGSDKPTPLAYISAAAIGTDVYVPGGCDSNGTPLQVVEVYDAVNDSWREAHPLPAPRCAHALTALDGKLYLFGGWDGEQYVSAGYVYDPQADTWAETAPMETGRGFAAAASLGSHIYVVGGYDGERELNTCAVYDPAARTWAECASLVVRRGGLGLAALGGQLYAIGAGGWTSFLGFNERYNPADDTWTDIETPFVGEWRSPGVVVSETAIYAIGGWNGNYLNLNQVYEPFPFHVFIPMGSQP